MLAVVKLGTRTVWIRDSAHACLTMEQVTWPNSTAHASPVHSKFQKLSGLCFTQAGKVWLPWLGSAWLKLAQLANWLGLAWPDWACLDLAGPGSA